MGLLRHPGQGELEQALRELIASGRRRDFVSVCLHLVAGARFAVTGLAEHESALAAWLAGDPVDIAASAKAADDIGAREYNDYAAPLDGEGVNYAYAARAAVVSAGCRVAAGGAWPDAETLAYDSLSAISGGGTVTFDVCARGLLAVRAARRYPDVRGDAAGSGYFTAAYPDRIWLNVAQGRFLLGVDGVESTGDAGDAGLKTTDPPTLERAGRIVKLTRATALDEFPLLGFTPVPFDIVRAALEHATPPAPLVPGSIRVIDLAQRRRHVVAYYLARSTRGHEVIGRATLDAWTSVVVDDNKLVTLQPVAPAHASRISRTVKTRGGDSGLRAVVRCEQGTLALFDLYEDIPGKNWEEECWTEVAALVREEPPDRFVVTNEATLG